MKKKVEQIFKKKIVCKVLSADLCRETIVHHAEGINRSVSETFAIVHQRLTDRQVSLWNTILSLAESLLRSNPAQTTIVAVSSTIYRNAFKMCSTFYRQVSAFLYKSRQT